MRNPENRRWPSCRDATRLADIVILDFAAEGGHLIFDGVVTIIYRNSILTRVAAVSRYATKLVEDKKFKAYAVSPMPFVTGTSGRHTFVPFAMEDGGRLGAHAQATLVEYAVAKRRLPDQA